MLDAANPFNEENKSETEIFIELGQSVSCDSCAFDDWCHQIGVHQTDAYLAEDSNSKQFTYRGIEQFRKWF